MSRFDFQRPRQKWDEGQSVQKETGNLCEVNWKEWAWSCVTGCYDRFIENANILPQQFYSIFTKTVLAWLNNGFLKKNNWLKSFI